MEVIRTLFILLLKAIAGFMRAVLILALVLLTAAFTLAGQALRFFAASCGVLVPLAVIAGLVVSTLYAAAMTYTAYGADPPALLPAALLVIALAGLGLSHLSWGALLAGGLAAYAIGTVIQSADILTRSLIIVGALATTIAHTQMTRQESENHANQEIEQRVYNPD